MASVAPCRHRDEHGYLGLVSVDEPTETSGQDLGAIAAIDIGTNSIHTVLARVLDRGRYEVLTREKATVRLGSGGGDMDTLRSTGASLP